MSSSQREWLVGAIMVLGLALAQIVGGGLTPAVWAGQAEQFTPEFKEVRKSLDPKHTPKIVAPDRVKRGRMVRCHGLYRERRRASGAERALHPVHRPVHQHCRDLPSLSPPGLLVP